MARFFEIGACFNIDRVRKTEQGSQMKDVKAASVPAISPGPVLRTLRLERGWSLADVSNRTGIPTSTLSKIETDKTELTMDRLLRISVALDINIADIIGSPRTEYVSGDRGRRSITRIGEGNAVSSPYGEVRYHAQDLLEKRVSPLVATITAQSIEEFGPLHRHVGEEFLLVLEGELALHTDTYSPVYLKTGESIYFDSEMGHGYVATGEADCRIMMICVPRNNDVVRTLDGRSDVQSIHEVEPLRPVRAVK